MVTFAIVSALASAAALLGVLAWLTLLSRRVAKLHQLATVQRAQLSKLITEYERLRQLSSERLPAKLSAEVADLAAGLDAHRRDNRREFGKLWAKWDGKSGGEHKPVANGDPEVDEDISALLALQTAPPPQR